MNSMKRSMESTLVSSLISMDQIAQNKKSEGLKPHLTQEEEQLEGQ